MANQDDSVRGERDEVLEDLRKEFRRSGNGEFLLMAVSVCLLHNHPAPSWLTSVWRESLERWDRWNVPTLGEAFGVKDRPSDPRSFEKQKRLRIDSIRLFARVREAHELGGRAIDQNLFDEVGREFELGATTAKEMYYYVKRIFDDGGIGIPPPR